MKNKRMITASVFAAGILAVVQVEALKPDRDKDNKNARIGTSQPSLEGALFNFNLFKQQPVPVIEMISEAWDVLSVNPDASYADLAQNPAFQSLCKKNGMDVLGGPLLGSVTADGVKVWMRTLKPAKVEVAVMVGDETRTFGPVNSTFESDLTAIVPVSGLEPGTRYGYQVLVDGNPISMPAHAAIVTAPEAKTTEKVRITFGSCFHRWGLGNQKQSDMIRSRNPTAMLLLGDIAAQDRENHLGLHRFDYLVRDQYPAWQDLVCTVPVYATWDDHDYFNNDKAGIPSGYTLEDKQQVCDLFKQAWNNPSYGFNDERRGVFLRTRIGPCDVIMVDNRYFREGNRRKGGLFLGEEQMQWLEDQLLDCQGPFIVLSCGSMWSDYVSNGKDSWGVWAPEARERIFNLIEKNKIGGVLLISGDRHGARGFTIPRPSGFEFYEFEAGSLGGRSGPPAKAPGWETQLFGISDQYAFGEFSMDGSLADPEVTFRLIEDTGTVIYEKTLTRSQLTP